MTKEINGVLVTGAGGFLGNHLCRNLTSNGYKGRVIALDNFSSGTRSRLDTLDGRRIDIVSADIRNEDDLATFMRKVDVVVHLAAISDPRACDKNPDLARSINVDGTAAVVRAARGKKVLFMSSAAVYGTPEGEASLSERSPLLGQGVYSDTKLEGERLVTEAGEDGRVEPVIMRNFNTFGGGQADAFLIPKLVKQALFEGCIEMWNCQPVRDFTYVEDTVQAISSLIKSDDARGIFNLGSGIPTRVGELACYIGRLLGVPVSCLNKAVTGSKYLVASNDRIRGETGWEPEFDLQSGLARTIDWFRAIADPESLRSSLSLPGKQAV